MTSNAESVQQYLEELPEDRKQPMKLLRQTILDNIPEGFSEEMSYGMIGYVVPHSLYPAGYHCDPKLPLPFINIASQKNSINLYHSGIYLDSKLLEWFQAEYPKHVKTKLDMGKSCMRFKKIETIPYDLIGELAGKMTVQDWVGLYEAKLKR
jgi:hypothetical protein